MNGSSYGKIGIIAGNGQLPEKIISGCISIGLDVSVALLDTVETTPESLHKTSNITVNIGSVGKVMKFFKKSGVSKIVFAGAIKRPKWSALRPDITGIKLLARITSKGNAGDDALLTIVIKFFEDNGFKVVGADEVLKDLLMPFGAIGKIKPTEEAVSDIDFGVEVAHTIGRLDIGQCVVVQNGVVLGIEAIEGTDAMIERCGNLKQEGHKPVLVKMKKPNQDPRVDLPTIGIRTIHSAYAAGFCGIAVEAGGTIIIDRNEVAKKADELGMFLVGV